MNGPDRPTGNNSEASKALENALAKLKANPKVIEAMKKKAIELEQFGISNTPSQSTVLRPTTFQPKTPPKPHFSEVDQPELVMKDGVWVRKEE